MNTFANTMLAAEPSRKSDDGSHFVENWPERLERARQLVLGLANGESGRDALAAIKSLASDAKWEVRCEVAHALRLFPKTDFEELSATLIQDSNSFVRRAAQNACNARRKSERQVARAFRAADDIDRQLDVMAQQKGESAARQARRICDRYGELMAGSLVHDLRCVVTSLTAACGNLIGEGNRRRTAAVRARESLDLLARMLTDAESLVRVLPMDRHVERLAGAVADAVEMATENVRANGFDPTVVELTTAVAPNLTVPMARRLIVMALANVVKNAIEAFAIGPKELRPGIISISAQAGGDGVHLHIRDNGSGMSQQELAECRRLLPGRRNKAKRFSTGYGLSIAARNIAGHGGSIEIESQEGEGTCITIYLPRDSEEPKP